MRPDPPTVYTQYIPSADPATDLIDVTVYNYAGQVLESRRLKSVLDGELEWLITHYLYDELNRQTHTIANFQGETFDLIGVEWDNDRWKDDCGVEILHGPNNDQNIITETIYDANGRIQGTRAVDGQLSRNVYDGFGRQKLTISNYVEQGNPIIEPEYWLLDKDQLPAPRWEDGNGNPIQFGDDLDQNSLTGSVYDENGRVQETYNAEGNVTRHIYDELSRQIKTIANYVPQNSTDPSNWVWNAANGQWEQSESDSTPIARYSTYQIDTGWEEQIYDINIITATTYDDLGRVQETRDARGNRTRYVYDSVGRRIRTIASFDDTGYAAPENWVWVNDRWEDGSGQPIGHESVPNSDNFDLNLISETKYDWVGRVLSTQDTVGSVTRYVYDILGRRIRTITNFDGTGYAAPENWVWVNDRWEDGSGQPIGHESVPNSDNFDVNLISDTVYNKAGQVVSTRDTRGTQAHFIYDVVGRRVQVKQAAESALESTSYTCYSKIGHTLRTITNWIDDGTAPDAQDTNGEWVLQPGSNPGKNNDQNRIVTYEYDGVGRRVKLADPVGNVTATKFRVAGQVDTITDPEGMVTLFRYNNLRRRNLVVQNYVVQGSSDPADWEWQPGGWEDGAGIPIVLETDITSANEDQNIIVQTTHDILGRRTSLRDPRGNLTAYEYDKLGRRIKLTNPLDNKWVTVYEDIAGASAGETLTNLIDPNGVTTTRTSDRIGRPRSIEYNDPNNTYDVVFTYNAAGNRSQMTEYSDVSHQTVERITQFSYDAARRMTGVDFGGETVNYKYGRGGQRTELKVMPDNLAITYTYDDKGRLIRLTDWDGQETQFAYDNANRLVAAERDNGLRSGYHYDTAGRLQLLRHLQDQQILAQFAYEVDDRGNRTQATEMFAYPSLANDVTYAYDDPTIAYQSDWVDDADTFKKTERLSAELQLSFFGQNALFTYGTGSNHSLFDVYINNSLWRSFDGYAVTDGEQTVDIELANDGPHIFEIRNRPEHSLAAEADANYDKTKFIVRFKQLLASDVPYVRTLEYTYDALSRLTEVRYNPGISVGVGDANLLRHYQYTYDVAGNRLSESVAVHGGTLTVTNYTYNAANQVTNTGFTYDNNGNLTSDGTNTYTWDRANRLTGMGGLTYQYDGAGNRIRQSDGVDVTQYLLDLQPGLVKVLATTKNGNTDRFVHSPRGIHAQQDNLGSWTWPVTDGLGSVRGELSDTLVVNGIQHYAPYGVEEDGVGAVGSPFRFTGEQLDDNGLLYLRARYYSPALGVFTGLDPLEGCIQKSMSLNRYGYVDGNVVNDAVGELGLTNGYSYANGNPVNFTDPSGMFAVDPGQWDPCQQQFGNDCETLCMVVDPGKGFLYDACVVECITGIMDDFASAQRALNDFIVHDCTDRSLAERNRSSVWNEATFVFNNIPHWMASGRSSQGEPDPGVKTRGVLLGGEASILLLSGGGAFAVMFEVDEWDAIWTDQNPQCGVFPSVEIGLGTGIDPIQLAVPALIWSTAPLSRIAGFSHNISGDLPYFVGGIAENDNDECDYTAFASFSGIGLTASVTMGFGIEWPWMSYL